MKEKRFVIGLTGGIATGKSTVLAQMKRLGAAILSADDLAHACMQRGTPVYARIVRAFGAGYLRPDGALDRPNLGVHIFKHAAARKRLERIVHPCVIRKLKAFIRAHKGLIALDIPLLYEAHLEDLVDAVVVVYASKARQLARMKTRNGHSRAQAGERINAQWSLEKKCRVADHVLRNQGSLEALQGQVRAYIKSIAI